MAIGGVGGISGLSGLTDLSALNGLNGLNGLGSNGSGIGSSPAQAAAATRGADFASAIGNGLSALDSMDRTAAAKAVQAATGDLTDIHDYVIAATQAQTATELTTTIRNKAIDAFNEIMRMPL